MYIYFIYPEDKINSVNSTTKRQFSFKMDKGLEYTFLQRRYADNEHMKIHLMSLIIRQIQIKTIKDIA